MHHTKIKLGTVYAHKLDGKLWLVRVMSVFDDRQRWGWEGTVQDGGEYFETPCWGWVSELESLPKAIAIR